MVKKVAGSNKKLGQHWLKDQATLRAICQVSGLNKEDTILEIGPGLGDLTWELAKSVDRVVAVELDKDLAVNLAQHRRAINVEIIQGDILEFDLTQLPPGYKVVANIPYYLTSNLIRVLSESTNPPTLMVLLVQKEVAERIAAESGQMSLLSVSAQLEYIPELGPVVPSKLFEPPPKVDSQVIILSRRPAPLFKNLDKAAYFKLVKAGFAGRRKKLRSSLAAGLRITKTDADELLDKSTIDRNLRAQNLSLTDWYGLYNVYKRGNIKLQ